MGDEEPARVDDDLWFCPECGVAPTLDEDGCCAHHGYDCIPMPQLHAALAKSGLRVEPDINAALSQLTWLGGVELVHVHEMHPHGVATSSDSPGKVFCGNDAYPRMVAFADRVNAEARSRQASTMPDDAMVEAQNRALRLSGDDPRGS